MLMSLENKVGKIREIYLNSPYITSVFSVPLKKYLKHTPTHNSPESFKGSLRSSTECQAFPLVDTACESRYMPFVVNS